MATYDTENTRSTMMEIRGKMTNIEADMSMMRLQLESGEYPSGEKFALKPSTEAYIFGTRMKNMFLRIAVALDENWYSNKYNLDAYAVRKGNVPDEMLRERCAELGFPEILDSIEHLYATSIDFEKYASTLEKEEAEA